MTSGLPSVTRFEPTPDQYAWTFGGYAPVMRVRPGDVLDLYTEYAFGGRIGTADDLPSSSITYPFINPQTGPFHVDGAEPGDTLAIHLIDVQPARDRAVSTTVPLFGALTRARSSRPHSSRREEHLDMAAPFDDETLVRFIRDARPMLGDVRPTRIATSWRRTAPCS
ncbi:MAG TPA: acetamidase/formamidase family protein, partial [Candidatus Limnocylindrales bacterium]